MPAVYEEDLNLDGYEDRVEVREDKDSADGYVTFVYWGNERGIEGNFYNSWDKNMSLDEVKEAIKTVQIPDIH